MRLQIALLLALTVCLPRLPSADAPETVRLKLIVTDTFGVPIESAQVAIVSVGPKQRFSGASDSSGEVLFTLSYGLYDVEVRHAGFLQRHERIGAYQASLVYRLGLALAYVDEPIRPEIRGTVYPVVTQSANRWVRLVSVYGGELVENSVDTNGRFVLRGFAPGRYLLILLEKDTVVSTKFVEALSGVTKVSISSTERQE